MPTQFPTLDPATLSSFSGKLVELTRDVTVVKDGDGFIKQVGKYTLGTPLLVLETSFALIEAIVILPFYITAKTFELLSCTIFSYRNVTCLTQNIVNPLGRAMSTSFLYVVIGGNRIFSRIFGEKYVRSTDKSIWGWFPSLQVNVAHTTLGKAKRLPTEVNASATQIAAVGSACLKAKDFIGLSKALKFLSLKVREEKNLLSAEQLAKDAFSEHSKFSPPVMPEELLDLFLALVNRRREKIYQEAAAAADIATSQESTSKKGLLLLSALGDRAKMQDDILKQVEKLSRSSDPQSVLGALDILQNIVQRGDSNDTLVTTILAADLSIEGVRERQVGIFKGLIQHQQSLPEATSFAQTLAESNSSIEREYSVSVFRELAIHGPQLDDPTARNVALEGLNSADQPVILNALDILRKLPNSAEHFEEMLAAAQRVEFIHRNEAERLTLFFKMLIEQNRFFPGTIAFAQLLAQNQDWHVVKHAEALFEALVEKREAIEEATQFAQQILTDDDLCLVSSNHSELQRKIKQARAAIQEANTWTGQLRQLVNWA